MKKISRRSFLASSVKAAMFSGFAAKGGAFAQSASWSNWSGGQTCQPAGRYDISSEEQLTSLLRKIGSAHFCTPVTGLPRMPSPA